MQVPEGDGSRAQSIESLYENAARVAQLWVDQMKLKMPTFLSRFPGGSTEDAVEELAISIRRSVKPCADPGKDPQRQWADMGILHKVRRHILEEGEARVAFQCLVEVMSASFSGRDETGS